MATPDQAIQILTTLEYLGPYNGIPYFGLVLQTGVGHMTGGTLTVDPKIQNILEPWMWWDPANATKPTSVQPPQIQLWQATPHVPAGVPLQDANGTDIKTEVLPLPKSASGQLSVDPSIVTQLGADCKAALDPTNGAPYLDWSDPTPNGSGSFTSRRDGKGILPWPAHLAQVTRYPYPIPHLLNLCFFIKAPGFDPAKVSDAKTYFFATINFKAEVDVNAVNYVRPDPKTFQAPDANSRLVIPLINADDATDNSVAVTTQPLTLPLATAAQVVLANSTAYTAETADWQAHLSSSVASTFDLSARLVDTVRQACDSSNGTNSDSGAVSLRNAVAAQFTGFVTAVLTAQREIVAYGCQTGPNGKSLLDRLLNAWVSDSKDPKNRTFATTLSAKVNTQRASDTTNNVASFDTWLALLKGRPVFATDPLLAPCPAGSTATVFDGTKKGTATTDPAYKKGDTVIFHGRSYIATSDVPSPPVGGPSNAIDAGHWRCFTPLLPFYDSSKTYQAGDRVLYADAVFQFSPVKPPVQTAPPGGNWQSASPFIPNVDPTKLPDRLIAVEHLQLQFTQPDILSQILLAQWKSVFDAPSSSWSTAENAQFQSFLNSASANLAVWDVRGLLLQCHIGKSWTNITQSPASRDSVRSAIQTQLDIRLNELLNQLPAAPGTTPVFAAPLIVKVDAWIGNRINLLVPAPTSAPAQPTRSAQGLSVMLGTLDANGAKANDQSDTLRSIAGYCVLMRQAGGSDWRCLNAGIPVASVNPPADATKPTLAIHDPDKKPDALPDPVVIPLPMHNQDGLRRAILTYDNQPLMCSSPAHAFGDGLVPTPKPDSARPFDRMISFQHLSVIKDLKDDTQWKIPGLAFKQSYEFLLGAVSNSGALPPEFADPKNPGVFKFDSVKTTAPKATITNVPYLRTVPVGDLRFASDYSNPKGGKPKSARLAGGVSFDKLNLPPIPPDVQPRASEIYRSSLAPVQLDGQAQPQPVVGTPPEKPSKPLIVLSPYDTPDQVSEFDLSIRKPTIDFLTWDRTQAAIAGTHQARQWAWQLFNTNARKQNSNFDLSLEDPAIDSLNISVNDESGASVTVTGLSTLPWPNADIQNPATAAALQTPTQPILLKITTNIDVSPNRKATLTGSPAVDIHSSPTFTLTLPQGFLGTITLLPKLKSGFEKQFAIGIQSAPTAFTLLVETANNAFPQQDKLQKFFSVHPPLAPRPPSRSLSRFNQTPRGSKSAASSSRPSFGGGMAGPHGASPSIKS